MHRCPCCCIMDRRCQRASAGTACQQVLQQGRTLTNTHFCHGPDIQTSEVKGHNPFNATGQQDLQKHFALQCKLWRCRLWPKLQDGPFEKAQLENFMAVMLPFGVHPGEHADFIRFSAQFSCLNPMIIACGTYVLCTALPSAGFLDAGCIRLSLCYLCRSPPPNQSHGFTTPRSDQHLISSVFLHFAGRSSARLAADRPIRLFTRAASTGSKSQSQLVACHVLWQVAGHELDHDAGRVLTAQPGPVASADVYLGLESTIL